MADPNIRIKRSSVAGKRPEISQVEMGELALNTNDGRLFTRKYNVGIGSTVTLLNPWTENIGGGVYYTDGNVGIGTTNPSAKLTIQGDVSITSTVGIGTVIDIVPYDTLNSGTLSWEGSAGQLFSITNNLTTGSIFSVNDVSGIPSIDVDANGTIQLGPYGGNIGIGTTNPTSKVDVVGDVKISGIVTATRFVSTQATGTAPFTVSSTTVVTNLNADLLDGLNSASTNTASTIVARDASGNFSAGVITANSYNVGTDVGISTTRTTVASTSATTIDSFAVATFRSARVQVQITQSTNYQTSDVLIIHDGSTASVIEYASIATNDYLGTFSGTISGGNCLLQINMSSASSATIKVLSQRITV